MGKATQDLRKEHEAILYVLRILDRMTDSAGEDEASHLRYYAEVVYFLETFVGKCHHGKEENYLFKALVAAGAPDGDDSVGEMLKEHAQGNGYVAQMSGYVDEKDIDAFNDIASRYSDLLHRHIQKENDVLFRVADKIIDDKTQDRMFEEFEQYEEDVIGHGIHEKLHAMIGAWAEAFGIE